MASRKVTPFPGGACQHFRDGRCLREEAVNPGLTRDFRCRIWLECEEDFDAFLTRADNFGLSDETAAAIWERRFGELAAKAPQCPSFAAAPGAEFPGCRHVCGDICALALPQCPGVCPDYLPLVRRGGAGSGP